MWDFAFLILVKAQVWASRSQLLYFEAVFSLTDIEGLSADQSFGLTVLDGLILKIWDVNTIHENLQLLSLHLSLKYILVGK